MKDAIRLTNKTAVALRRGAQKARTAHYAAIAIMDIAAAVLSVYWGLKWLPAVPLTLALAALISAAAAMHGRRVYLQMIGQAICTEAAAREIRAGASETLRREKALSDLMAVKADAASAAKPSAQKAPGVKPFFEKKAEDDEEKDLYDEPMPRMEDDEEDEDMLPPKKGASAPSAAPRRRRQQGNLQIIRNEQAK